MKKQFIKAFTMLALIVTVAFVSAVTSAYGQMAGRTIRADIPFDFAVGDKTLKAGEYTVRCVTTSSDNGLIISSVDNESHKMFLTNPVQAAKSSDKVKLVFNKYGDQYYLSQVWASGSSVGRELFKSRSERETERQLAKNASENEQSATVAIIARWQ